MGYMRDRWESCLLSLTTKVKNNYQINKLKKPGILIYIDSIFHFSIYDSINIFCAQISSFPKLLHLNLINLSQVHIANF